MHEFSIASQAVNKIMETALKKGAKRIRSIEILIGELSLVGQEQFSFWMKEMLSSKGEIARDVKIDLKRVAAIIKCNQCGYQGNLKAKDEDHFHPIFMCPSCNQGDFEIEKGRECVLKKIKLEV